MLDSLLAKAIEYIQKRTAFPGWVAEFLVAFALFTLCRSAIAVWNGTILAGVSLWTAIWAAYDNLTLYAEDSAILALIFTVIVEVAIIVLARKRMRIEREEGLEKGREEGRAEVRAELEPIIKELQERVRQLENGRGDADQSATSSP